MTKWICANCGARHESNNPPCQRCAHEQFARLEEDDSSERIESTDRIEWECTECGTRHVRNNPPCNNCGNMTMETVYLDEEESERQSGGSGYPFSGSEDSRKITLRLVAAYAFGILAILNFTGALIYLSVLPGILFIVAVFSVFPPARRSLERRFNIQLSTPAAVTIYAVATFAGNMIFLLTELAN